MNLDACEIGDFAILRWFRRAYISFFGALTGSTAAGAGILALDISFTCFIDRSPFWVSPIGCIWRCSGRLAYLSWAYCENVSRCEGVERRIACTLSACLSLFRITPGCRISRTTCDTPGWRIPRLQRERAGWKPALELPVWLCFGEYRMTVLRQIVNEILQLG